MTGVRSALKWAARFSKQTRTSVHTRHKSSGFVVSTEMMLIAVILALGLITGWVKLRDQSLAEVKDTMAAIDAYILGSGPVWQIGGTRWIQGGAVLAPGSTGAVSEKWGSDPDPAFWTESAPAAELVPSQTSVYQSRDGFLVYGAPDPE